MESIIVGVLLSLSLGWVTLRIYKGFSSQQGCSGCSGCIGESNEGVHSRGCCGRS